LCTCVLVYLCTCVLVYLCTCVLVYLCTCVLVYLCTCVLVYLCVYGCTCVLVRLRVYDGQIEEDLRDLLDGIDHLKLAIKDLADRSSKHKFKTVRSQQRGLVQICSSVACFAHLFRCRVRVCCDSWSRSSSAITSNLR
jgi:hypothetical protein